MYYEIIVNIDYIICYTIVAQFNYNYNHHYHYYYYIIQLS